MDRKVTTAGYGFQYNVYMPEDMTEKEMDIAYDYSHEGFVSGAKVGALAISALFLVIVAVGYIYKKKINKSAEEDE